MPGQPTFTTVRTEGGLLPSDLLARIVAGDSALGGLAASDYGFAPNERLGEVVSRLWNDAKTYWEAFKADQRSLAASESGVTETRDWVLRLLRELGYGRPEFRAAAEELNGRRYPIQHRSGPVPLHILSFQQDLDRSAVAVAGQPRLSPHALLQEYLNASEAALYGIVTNGLQLRLLRDNASLTRLSAVEFDLEAMFENSVYADFVLLFLVLHRTRLPQEGQEVSACWLEVWRAKAETQGTRALGALRAGVEKAIEALGNGLLGHPANDALRDRLRGGELATEDFYAQLLRLVYRLIFLFVAEERDLLHPDGARPEMRQRYADNYSASRLRGVARRFRTDDRHDDLWRSLRVTIDLLAGRRDGLDLIALEGIFAADACPDIDLTLIANNFLAEAVLQLSNVRVDKRVRRVNYRDLGAEELGGVYEGLLERQPRVNVDAPIGQRFELVGSGQRKTTGSYYTPTTLVNELIKSALEPVIAYRLAIAGPEPETKERAVLEISVCDAACGSGHFLLAAARRLASELARLRSQDREPGQRELRLALRDVVRHCLYGVDLNPLAVDLCHLSLWLESQDRGRPLSFLNHHVKVGNSLVGANHELLAKGIPDAAYEAVTGDERSIALAAKKRNKKEGTKQTRMFSADESGWSSRQTALAQEMLTLTMLPEDVARDVRRVRASYEAYRHQHVDPARWPLDIWTASFFWQFAQDAPPAPSGFDVVASSDNGAALSQRQRAEVVRLRDEFRFFHWSLEFPEVFRRGGFDCVLGNPPWDMLQLDPAEFFKESAPEISAAGNMAKRQRLINQLPSINPLLAAVYGAAKRAVDGQQKFVHASGRFPLTSYGRLNLAPLFTELDRSILGEHSRAGLVVPTGIATDSFSQYFFRNVVEQGSLATLFDFENRKVFFEDVHASYKFALLTLSSARVDRGDLAFFLSNTGQLVDNRRRFQLSAADFALLNPNTRTCPVFRTRPDADLTRAIYGRVPVLVNEENDSNPWGFSGLLLFMMNTDSHLFHEAPGPGLVPLYEAKLFHQFNHRWAAYGSQGEPRDASSTELADPDWTARPRYWVARPEVEERLAGRWDRGWLLAWRRIARATDERSFIATVLPRTGVGDSAFLFLPMVAEGLEFGALLGNLNSLAFDYVVRQKLGGVNMMFFTVRQLPVLPPSAYTPEDLRFITPHVLELTYNAWDLQPFSQSMGYDGAPFRWDEERRALLRAELDAYYAALYGLTRDELRYVLNPADIHGSDFPGETFRVLKERETRQFGEYRTRRLVLEAWDRLGLEPRNRDGHYSVEGTNAGSTAPMSGAESGRVARHTEEAHLSVATRVTVAQERRSDPPPLVLQQQVASSRTPVSQPTLLGLRSDEATVRARALDIALQVIARSAPITAKDIAQQLAAIDARFDRTLVNSVLYHEGADMVAYDETTGLYRLK